MPKDDSSRKGRGGGREKEESAEHRRRRREERRGPSGEQKVFAELVQRRLGGGATPTAQAYATAMQKWQKLPGAVQFVAVPKFPKSRSSAPDNPGGPAEKPPTGRKKTGESA